MSTVILDEAYKHRKQASTAPPSLFTSVPLSVGGFSELFCLYHRLVTLHHQSCHCDYHGNSGANGVGETIGVSSKELSS